MQFETIELKDQYPFLSGGYLRILAIDCPFGIKEGWARPMVIVVPGGAYLGVAKREAEPIAADFFAKGYQVAILNYLCREQGAAYPEQLFELASSIDFIRKNAKRLNVNPKEIFAVGFSAGGHLVADYSSEFPSLSERAGVPLDCAVTAVGLSYPVIDDHDESFENLLFSYESAEKERLKGVLKAQNLISKQTPPTFLWTTATDNLVPAANSLRYALALAERGVPYEIHVYPKGGHGMSDGSLELNENAEAATVLSAWTKDMARFFRSYCEEKF